MKLSYRFAPAHRILACAGVVLFLAVVAGCDKSSEVGATGDRTLELSHDTVDVASGVTLHDVRVRSVGSSDFHPAELIAKSGDIIRFTSFDTRTHAILIDAPTAEAKSAFDASGQSRSPPLVSKGQAWVVSLEKMPAGSYQVRCISHAGTVSLTVR